MGKTELIACFQDTLKRSNSKSLKRRTKRAVKSNRVYKEGFVSKVKHRKERAYIEMYAGAPEVYAGTTFGVAKRYCRFGKVAVLNFANPEHPGGGVLLGAMAQEESLCRSSNLYACLSSPNIFDEYYGYHRGIRSHFYTDRLIYTKNVTVFKNDSLFPQMLPEEDWFDVDVITCAAPYLAGSTYTNGVVLLNLFKSRAKNIFEAARENQVDYLILGAFGCGAFRNPPRIVAEAFDQIIMEQEYFKDFKQIIFAIKPTGADCPNLSTFMDVFPGGIEECIPLQDPWRLCRYPALPDESRFSDNSMFRYWQRDNAYFGKQFSILGDSISTLQGFNPEGYKIFYAEDNGINTGVAEVSDTWWDKVIGFFGGELLVNNSWSGSRVTKWKGQEQLFPSGCSDERTAALHTNDVKPDVILIYLGTNDWGFGAKTGNETRILEEDPEEDIHEFFDAAYDCMLEKVKVNYPESEIWCCTLCETYMSKNPDFQFPHKYAGTHIEEYNEIIREAAGRNNCKLIDLYEYSMPYDSIDGSHPTNTGMNTIATMMIRSIGGFDADRFLDCEDDRHEYKVVGEECGDIKYICSCCGKIKRNECQEDQHKYEIYDQDIDGDYYRCRKCGSKKFLNFWETVE